MTLRQAGTSVVLAIACFLSPFALGAQWKQIAKGEGVELWLDVASVKRNNGEAAFEYRIDFATPQQEVGSRNLYRSTLTRAMVRCAARTMAMGLSIAYADPKARGKVIGRYPPSPEEARFQPVERGSSDENLWRHVCQVAKLKPKS